MCILYILQQESSSDRGCLACAVHESGCIGLYPKHTGKDESFFAELQELEVQRLGHPRTPCTHTLTAAYSAIHPAAVSPRVGQLFAALKEPRSNCSTLPNLQRGVVLDVECPVYILGVSSRFITHPQTASSFAVASISTYKSKWLSSITIILPLFDCFTHGRLACTSPYALELAARYRNAKYRECCWAG